MSKKFKATVRLEPNEAYVVASVEMWNHIIGTYNSLAEQIENEDDKNSWYSLAEYIQGWVNDTAHYDEPNIDDDDWQ